MANYKLCITSKGGSRKYMSIKYMSIKAKNIEEAKKIGVEMTNGGQIQKVNAERICVIEKEKKVVYIQQKYLYEKDWYVLVRTSSCNEKPHKKAMAIKTPWEFTEDGWAMQIEDLNAFVKDNGQCILSINEGGFKEVEIYDGWRE